MAKKQLMKLLVEQGARQEILPQVLEALTGRPAASVEELGKEELKRALEEVKFIQRALDKLDVSARGFWTFWITAAKQGVKFHPPREGVVDYFKTLVF